ncbi:MAG: hypothetical protein ACSLE5_00530, partial [Porticoccaceae bacterium]
ITLWQSRTVFHRQHLVEELIPWQPGKDQAFQPLVDLAGGDDTVVWGIAEQLTNLQALTLGLADTFMLLAILVIPVVLLIPFLPAKMPKAAEAVRIGGE